MEAVWAQKHGVMLQLATPSPSCTNANSFQWRPWQQPWPKCRSSRAKLTKSLSIRAEAVTVRVLTSAGESKGEEAAFLELKTARADTARAVVHRGVITQLQNRRRGTASTLTRGQVRGGGRKPYKQKGSGRARRGSNRSPLIVGGGVIFGPKPKDWSIKMNKKERRLALSTALMSAAAHDSVSVVEDDFCQALPSKTKEFIALLRRWGVNPARHSLLFCTEVAPNVALSSRNLKTVKVLTPRTLNLYDVLRAEKLIFTLSGIQYLNRMYGLHSDFEAQEAQESGKEEVKEQDLDVQSSSNVV